MSKPDALAILNGNAKRGQTYRKSIGLRIEDRILCHLQDLGASVQGVVDDALHKLLIDAGLDLSKPHPNERFADNDCPEYYGNRKDVALCRPQTEADSIWQVEQIQKAHVLSKSRKGAKSAVGATAV